MNEFEELGLTKELLNVLEEMNFKTPSEIQKKTIPLILEGKDVIGNAATGSGKTLAFAAGIIAHCVPGQGVQALVLTPTRELAEQITKVTKNFSKKSGLRIQDVYGGVNIERQISGVRVADVIVGTPGRLLDHLQRKTFSLSALKILVLDEADRMVDMGFAPDVEKIISQCPEERQTLLFSATTSADVDHIAKKHMKNPEEVIVETYVDKSLLKQVYYDVPNHLKFSLLVHLLKAEKSNIVMVFCNTRRNVDLIASNLKRYKLHAHAIHGGLEQNKRSRIMEQFHKGEANILICTDVAARGLDIKGVSHVYNYDSPKTSDEYIHRIGRTARAGNKGMAISIVSNRDYDNFRSVMQDDSLDIEKVEVPEIEKLNPNFQQGGDDRRGFGGRRDSRGGGRQGGRGYSGGRSGRSDRSYKGKRDSSGGRPSFGGRDSGGGRSQGGSGRNSRGRNGGRHSSGGRSGRSSGGYSNGKSGGPRGGGHGGGRHHSSGGPKGGGKRHSGGRTDRGKKPGQDGRSSSRGGR